jgi:hypothetical protein
MESTRCSTAGALRAVASKAGASVAKVSANDTPVAGVQSGRAFTVDLGS